MPKKSALLLLILAVSCGPRPGIRIQEDKTPQAVWEAFIAGYENIHSLALSGSFTISEHETHEFKLQLIFASPDSFAFLAEGTLGADLARGAVVGDSGFWEIPRENFSEPLGRGDQILFGEPGIPLDISTMLEAIFFFIDRDNFTFQSRDGSKYIYSNNDNISSRQIELSRDSATPVRRIFAGLDDTVFVDYFDWRLIGENRAYPGRIKVNSPVSGMTAEYLVNKTRINPSGLRPNFLRKL